ncbi:MAG TPA: hypothetical protein VKZ63_10475, partial [Kofleriaceae bacterium]|nr:hypothetical protein [Kofleriaceae bacterium]
MVLEASGQGFRVLAWRRFDRENKLIAIYRLRVPEPALAEAMEKLADRLGDAYDTLSLFGYLLRKWFKLKRTPFDSREKLICSEAVALFLAWGGVPVDEQKVVTPQDLLELVQSRPDLFELVDRGSGFDRVIEKAQRARRKKERRRQRSAVSTTSPAG